MVRQTINLHLVPDVVKPTIYLEQYDNNLVQLAFNLVGTSDYYNIPSGTYVTLVGRKPDRKAFSYACTWSGHTVTVDVTDQMTAVPGKVQAQLRFTNSSGDTVLSSVAIEMIVNRSPLDGLTCSKNDFVSVDSTLLGARSDAVAAQKYAEDAQEAYNNTVEVRDTAVSDINSTKDTAISEVNSAKDSALGDLNELADEVESVFETSAEAMQAYVEYPNDTIYQYIEATNSFKISTLAPNTGN